MLGKLREIMGIRGASPAALEAVAALEVAPVQKVGSTKVLPTYLTSARQSSDTFLSQDDLQLANLDTTTLRNGRTTSETLRNLAKASPDLSAAIFSAVRLGVSGSYLALARTLDGKIDREGTLLVQQLCRRFDLLGPSDGGYNAYPSLRSASESMGAELMLLGACSLEVVLGKTRLPEALLPIAIDTIKFKYDKARKIPYQIIGGEEISLDHPTFFYLSLDQSLRTAYANSPVESSIPPMLSIQTFVNDLRRVFHRAIHPRIRAMINEERWRKTVPADILADADKLQAFMNSTVAQIKTLLDSLNPEDALVLFDTLGIEYMTGGNTSLSDEYKTLAGILNGKLASGAKTMPTVLGHESAGSQNIASTQSMLYLKTIEGAIIGKLNEILSRALTLCIRLFGIEAVVEFEYDKPNLRPNGELEAFFAMKQSRILEQLSLGLIDDDEASLRLTGTLPPVGYKLLAGTMFKAGTAANISTPESNTSALNQDLSGDAPKEKKS